MRKTPTPLLPPALALTVAMGLAAACGGGGAEEEQVDPPAFPTIPPTPRQVPLPPDSALNCPTGTRLNYDNFGEGFLLDHCTMCHSAALAEGERGDAPLGTDFDTPDDVLLWRSAIAGNATGATASMPPINNVSANERKLFAEWINCGAPSGSDNVE